MRRAARSPRSAPGAGGSCYDRRGVLGGLLAACSASALAGCEGGAFAGSAPDPNARGRAALLLPLSGPQAQLGQSLREAATLGGTTIGLAAEIEVLDAGADPDSAVRAALAGIDAGASMILGPLFSEQARAVAEAVPGGVPVVALSNDDTLGRAGAFVYGVTPLHSARAVLAYAASRGLSDIGIAVPPGEFGERAVDGARAVADELGVTLRDAIVTNDGAAIAAAYGTGGPDAIYLPAAGPELSGLAAAARATGAQILGSTQWSALDLSGRPELDGAWYAAPDPLRFAPFAQALEERGVQAGIVAGLVFDAVEMARLLGRLEQQTRQGLLRDKGFNGVLGPYRFLKDGRTERGLAILGVGQGAVTVLGTPRA